MHPDCHWLLGLLLLELPPQAEASTNEKTKVFFTLKAPKRRAKAPRKGWQG